MTRKQLKGVLGHAVAAGLAAAALALPSAAGASTGGIGSGAPGGGASGGAQDAGPSTGAEPGAGQPASPSKCAPEQLGARVLRLGDCGKDVATLNWILRARRYATPFAKQFARQTEASVRAFQRAAKLAADGIVDGEVVEALVEEMRVQRATWYGPGFFGNTTACGQKFTPRTKGVAHKTLPCGSRVVIRYEGRFARTRVIDRGPYANGASWDLTAATARKLRFEHTDDIRVAKIPKRVTADRGAGRRR